MAIDFNLLFQNPAMSPVEATFRLMDNQRQNQAQAFAQFNANRAAMMEQERNQSSARAAAAQIIQQQYEFDKTFGLDERKYVEDIRSSLAKEAIDRQNAESQALTAQVGAGRLQHDVGMDQRKFGLELAKFDLASSLDVRKDAREERQLGLNERTVANTEADSRIKRQMDIEKQIKHKQLGMAMTAGRTPEVVQLLSELGQTDLASTYAETKRLQGFNLVKEQNALNQQKAMSYYQGAVKLKQLAGDSPDAARAYSDYVQEGINSGLLPDSAGKNPEAALNFVITNQGAATMKTALDGQNASPDAINLLMQMNSPEVLKQAELNANRVMHKNNPNFSTEILQQDSDYYNKKQNNLAKLDSIGQSQAALKTLQANGIDPGQIKAALVNSDKFKQTFGAEVLAAAQTINQGGYKEVLSNIKGGGFGSLSENELKFITAMVSQDVTAANLEKVLAYSKAAADRYLSATSAYEQQAKSQGYADNFQAFMYEYNSKNPLIAKNGNLLSSESKDKQSGMTKEQAQKLVLDSMLGGK